MSQGPAERETRVNKKTFAFGVGSVAAALAMSSVAFACTTYKGKMTVTTGSQSSWAYGNGTGMGYCSGPTDSNPSSTPPGANLNNASNGTFDVAVAPTGTGVSGCSNTQLQDTVHSSSPTDFLTHRHYYVRFVNPGFTYTGSNPRSYSWSVDCMEGASGARVPSDTTAEITITSGSGSKTGVALTTTQMGSDSAAGQTAAVCVSSNGGGQGLQVPLQII